MALFVQSTNLTLTQERLMQIVHIVLTAQRQSRLPLWSDEGAYMEALRRLGRTCGGKLALFAMVAEHVHLVALASRPAAGRLAQATILSLQNMASTPLAPSYIEQVTTRSHMRWLLRYVLAQPIKHKMPGHPALWVGSCFPDLLGARAIAGLSLRIGEVLPDFQPRQALEVVGLPGNALHPANRPALRTAGVMRLVHSAVAAFGEPSLRRNTPAARLARKATIQIAQRVGIPTREIAAAMSMSPKTIWRHRNRDTVLEAMLTVARRVALDDLVEQVRSGSVADLAG